MYSRLALCCILLGWLVSSICQGQEVQLKPIPLGNLNTDRDEDDPHVASSGLQLFYTSGAEDGCNVMLSQRRVGNQAWPAGKPFADLQGKPDCKSVFLTRDDRYPQRLYFATNKDPEKDDQKGDNFDLYFLLKQ